MTTPVFTTAGQNVDGGKMAFVMEARMGNDPLKLPLPADSRCNTSSSILGHTVYIMIISCPAFL